MATHAGGPGSLDVLEPWVANDVRPPAMEKTINLDSNPSVRLWTINNASYLVDWERPTIQELAEGAKLPYDAYANYTDYKQKNNETGWDLPDIYDAILLKAQDIFHIPQNDKWIYSYINNYSEAPENHPMHLHGHDFWILSQGEAWWFPNNGTIKTKDPPRRNVATLFNYGHLVIAFRSYNLGIWLMHCHIAWHVAQGMAWQYLEQGGEILETYDMGLFNKTCRSWDEWIRTKDGSEFGQDDSGD